MNAGANCKTTKNKNPVSNFKPLTLPEDYDTLRPMTSSRRNVDGFVKSPSAALRFNPAL
jgi:hypothetical protein